MRGRLNAYLHRMSPGTVNSPTPSSGISHITVSPFGGANPGAITTAE